MDNPVSKVPSLSYTQLFSFQVSYEGTKKGEQKHGILELDFLMQTLLIQDKGRIFLMQSFSAFKNCEDTDDSENCSFLLKFSSDQWEIGAQNSAEKACIQYLLQKVIIITPVEDIVQTGLKKCIIGLDKTIIKYGSVGRKNRRKRLDECQLFLLPGKMFLFKNPDIKGKHVRYVTSLFGATIRILAEENEFQILAPGTKTMSLVSGTLEELRSWVEAIGTSIDYAKHAFKMIKQTGGNMFNKMPWQNDLVNQDNPLSCSETDDSAADPANKGIGISSQSSSYLNAPHSFMTTNRDVDSSVKESLGSLNPRPKKTLVPRNYFDKRSRAKMYLENSLAQMADMVGSIRMPDPPPCPIISNNEGKVKKNNIFVAMSSDWIVKENQSLRTSDALQDELQDESQSSQHIRSISRASHKGQKNRRSHSRKNSVDSLCGVRESLENLKREKKLNKDLAQCRKILCNDILSGDPKRSLSRASWSALTVQLDSAVENLPRIQCVNQSADYERHLRTANTFGFMSHGPAFRQPGTPQTSGTPIHFMRFNAAVRSSSSSSSSQSSTEDEEDEEEEEFIKSEENSTQIPGKFNLGDISQMCSLNCYPRDRYPSQYDLHSQDRNQIQPQVVIPTSICSEEPVHCLSVVSRASPEGKPRYPIITDTDPEPETPQARYSQHPTNSTPAFLTEHATEDVVPTVSESPEVQSPKESATQTVLEAPQMAVVLVLPSTIPNGSSPSKETSKLKLNAVKQQGYTSA